LKRETERQKKRCLLGRERKRREAASLGKREIEGLENSSFSLAERDPKAIS